MSVPPSERPETRANPDATVNEVSFDIKGMSLETADKIALATGGLLAIKASKGGFRTPVIHWDAISLDIASESLRYRDSISVRRDDKRLLGDKKPQKVLPVVDARIVIRGTGIYFARMDSEGIVTNLARIREQRPYVLEII